MHYSPSISAWGICTPGEVLFNEVLELALAATVIDADIVLGIKGPVVHFVLGSGGAMLPGGGGGMQMGGGGSMLPGGDAKIDLGGGIT